jgi:hypothetical protein
MKDSNTKTPRTKRSTETMRAEADFSGGIHGKYADQYRLGINVVLLEPELTEAFPNSKSVNDALRGLLVVASRTGRQQKP